jgi:hypothetical protein
MIQFVEIDLNSFQYVQSASNLVHTSRTNEIKHIEKIRSSSCFD